MIDLGSKLKNLRENSKLLQIDVAKALQISNRTLSDYERNRSEPDIDMLKKLTVFYNVSIDSLLNELKQNNDMLKNNESKKSDNTTGNHLEREIINLASHLDNEDLLKTIGYMNSLNEKYDKKDKSNLD